MKDFIPERVMFESDALKYPLGKELLKYFEDKGIETIQSSIRNIQAFIPGQSEQERYARAKRTLVVTTKKSLKFDVCKPSADYEFSLVTNCPGHCEYCYLQTTQAFKPYLRVYVNLEDIFDSIKKHIENNENKLTTFEVASAGDPLALEHITGTLSKTVEFFGTLENGRLRVVTKYSNVEPLLSVSHNEHTRFRVTINSRYVIDNFEHSTSSFEDRIIAASKLAAAGYPIGFIVAPIMVYEGWKEEYAELFTMLKEQIKVGTSRSPITFELIQHRFTAIAKKKILERFPNTKLDMDEEKRVSKWGKFGKFKYVYKKEAAAEIKQYISSLINSNFPDAQIEYFT